MTDQQVDTSSYVYLCMVPNFWGSAKTEAGAKANCRRAGGDTQRHGFVIYRVHPKFNIDSVDGSVLTPIGHPAIKVRDTIKRKARR